MTIYGNDQKTPKQSKKFLSSNSNKTALLKFFFDTWINLNTDVEIFTTFEDNCVKLYDGKRIDVEALKCDHEEADTRLLFHAKHASESYSKVMISSPDTDVAIIALSLYGLFEHIHFCFLTGKGRTRRVLDINKIQSSIGESLSKALVGLHCFTGCDTVSAFHGKGKIRELSLLIKNACYRSLFENLGKQFYLAASDTIFQQLEAFVCELYAVNETKVNVARYDVFCKKQASEENLPPTQSALLQHSKRESYQTAIHKRSLQQNIEAPSPVGYGWELGSDLQLTIKWHAEVVIPADLGTVVSCSCKSICETNRCSCRKSSLMCTQLCKCKQCTNNEPFAQPEDNDDESDDNDSDDELL